MGKSKRAEPRGVAALMTAVPLGMEKVNLKFQVTSEVRGQSTQPSLEGLVALRTALAVTANSGHQ